MAKQSIVLDPDAQAYTDDEIVGKVNTAAAKITRADAVSSPAVDLTGKDADDLAESATKKYAGVSGADFKKSVDTLEEITEGTTKKHFTSTEKTKLTGVEDGAKADQTGTEMVTALEALGAGSRLGSDKIDQEADGKFVTDAEKTKVTAIDQVYSNPEKTKLTGIAEGAQVNPADLDGVPDSATRKAMLDAEKTKLTGIETGATGDQSGAEMVTAIVAVPDVDRKLVITEPIVGEFPAISIQRKATGKVEVSYDDVPKS